MSFTKAMAQIFNRVFDAGNNALMVNIVAGGGGGTGGGGPTTLTQQDAYTSTGAGVTKVVGTSVAKSFSLQVSKTGSVTSWSVNLEVSNDNVNFQPILTLTNTDGDGSMKFTAQELPCKYFRTNCTALTLGAGTEITATALGVS